MRNIYRIQTYNSIICRYFYIGFILLLDYRSLLSPDDYEKNDKTILKYFQ